MPLDRQVDEKRRGEFSDYILNLKGWSINESLKDRITDEICLQQGDRLEEYISTFKLLLVYTDKKYEKELHRSDTRKKKPNGIKKGMHVSLIIEPLKKPSNYLYTMRIYFTYKGIIYDFEIGKRDF
jgi:hypothetical protein